MGRRACVGLVLLSALTGLAVAAGGAPGTLDTSFGKAGKTTVDFGGEEALYGLAVRPNGSIVVVGSSQNGKLDDSVAAQLTADGAPDSSFGAGGKTDAGVGTDDRANAVAVQRDGKLVLAGAAGVKDSLKYYFFLSRVNPSGFFDQSFGTGGKAFIDFGGANVGHAVAITPEGKIIVVGTTTKGTT